MGELAGCRLGEVEAMSREQKFRFCYLVEKAMLTTFEACDVMRLDWPVLKEAMEQDPFFRNRWRIAARRSARNAPEGGAS